MIGILPRDPPTERELGARQDLGVHPAHVARDIGRAKVGAEAISAWRAIRRAVTPLQVSLTTVFPLISSAFRASPRRRL